MSKFDENLFGRIAVFKNYLTWEQLDECLKVQRSQDPERRLGEILRERGYLSPEQLQTILEIRRRKIRKLLRNPNEARECDKTFGEIALEFGYIKLEDLESAVLEQERLGRINLHFRLGEILVASGCMRVSEVQEVLGRQGKRIMVCPLCDAHYNVLGYRRVTSYHCPKCQGELDLPKFLDTVAVDAFIEDSDSSTVRNTKHTTKQQA